jgi:hypothetical protein
LIAGKAVLLSGLSSLPSIAADPADVIAKVATLDTLEEVADIDPTWRCSGAVAWSFRPSRVRQGREKLLAVDVEHGTPLPDEWETIARRLYGDCRRVVLTPLLGGFMSNTFRVASYDGDGRRLLPTVLKIGGVALTEREEVANRKYVQTFILNNSTTLLGGAVAGDWAGLRYNFLGVTGPECSLAWLRDHYQRRPAAEVVPLVHALFTRVLACPPTMNGCPARSSDAICSIRTTSCSTSSRSGVSDPGCGTRRSATAISTCRTCSWTNATTST